MKNKILKQCSIKNILIIICILILLYLIYDVYVVRENFQISAWDLFKDSSQLDAATGAADELDDFCEKIQQLHALCTRCESDDQKFSENDMCDWGDDWGFTENEPGKQYVYLGSNVDGFNTVVSKNGLLENSYERYVRCGEDYEPSGNRLGGNNLKCVRGIIGISGNNFTCVPKKCKVSIELSNNFVYDSDGGTINQDIKHHWFREGNHRIFVKCRYPEEWYDTGKYLSGHKLDKDKCLNEVYEPINKCKMRELTLNTESVDFDPDEIFDASGRKKLNDHWGPKPMLNYEDYKTKLELISNLIKPTEINNNNNYFTKDAWDKISGDDPIEMIILDKESIETNGKINFKLKQLVNDKVIEEEKETEWWKFWD